MITKPTISSNTDGNIFNVLGEACRALREDEQVTQEAELRKLVMNCESYSEALSVIMEYVEI